MAKPISEEAQILQYFNVRPIEHCEIILGLIEHVMNQRRPDEGYSQAVPGPNGAEKPRRKRRTKAEMRAEREAQSAFLATGD